MKKLIIFCFCLFFSVSLWSQIKGSSDRYVMEINWNYWLNAPQDIQVKPFSRGFNTFVMFDFPFKEKSHFSVALGPGLSSENVYHNGRFINTDTTTQLVPINDSIKYKRNKLNTNYLEAPLEFRFRTKPLVKSYRLKIAVGLRGGMLISSHIKFIGQGTAFGQPGDNVKIKEYKVPNLAKYRYGLTARVGFGPFNFIGYYGLSTLFDQGLGPAIVPVSIGFTFNML